MKIDILKELSCPSCKNYEESNLSINEMWEEGLDNEVIEGFISCESCKKVFPIIFGMPILVSNPDEYIAINFVEIQYTKEMIGGISSKMLSYISKTPTLIYTNKFVTSSYQSLHGLGMYISMHYEEIKNLIGNSNAEKNIQNLMESQNFFQRCYDLLKGQFNGTTLACDLGSSVGGISYRLSFDFDRVISLDLSFLLLATAKALINQFPIKKSTYVIIREALNLEERNINLIRRENVEFIIGDINNLCIKNNLADCVTTFNMLEITSNPTLLINENKRILNKDGILCLTSPFYWRPDRTPFENWIYEKNVSSSDSLIRVLEKEDFLICQTFNNIPWILRYYNRYFQIWLNDLIIAKKT